MRPADMYQLRRFSIAIMALLVAQPCAWSDPVLEWDALMLGAIRVDNSGPTLSSRNLAILHAGIYDAVNAIERTHQSYFFTGVPAGDASPEAAVAAAGHRTMSGLYPSFQARTDELYWRQRAAMPDTARTTNGLDLGRQVALAILTARGNDGAHTQVPYIPSAAPGQWRRTPPFFRPPVDPHWRYVQPFAVPEVEPYVCPPPPPLESVEYAAVLNEVKILGGAQSAVRTPEQSEIAVFWSDFSYTAMPPGHWHEIAAAIARDRGTSLAENARLFALLSFAQADAAIVCWEGKYRYNFWRPVTAIQRADEDANPATQADPAWNHLLPAPPFPDHPSGHSTFSKASAEVLTRFFGTDNIRFSVTSDSLPGVIRHFDSLAACADEVGRSRIYGGIHFETANRDGKNSGELVGDFVSANYLLPNSALPQVRLEGESTATRRLRVHGIIGQVCVVEASPDLAGWNPVATNTAIPGGFVVPNVETEAGNRFFRARSP